MRRVILTIAALALIGLVGAVAIISLGLYNVSARQGHWPGVATVLHTAFKQSVRLRAVSEKEVPDDLDAPDRLALGALHFKTACMFCHAAPGQERGTTALSMNPRPPHIVGAAGRWTPQELFWIVREGVKMTGMPHWPASGRDDEIWSVVAYLRAVDALSADEQVALVGAGGGAASCTQCHGAGGRSKNSYVPRLDLLTSDQIAQALEQYRDGTRPSGFMQVAAGSASDAEIATLAAEFGREEPPMPGLPEPRKGEPSPVRQLATRGSAEVPACTSCHGPGRKAEAAIAPAIAGQSRDYLVAQIKLWRDGRRGGGMRAELMRKAVADMSDTEIEALADWFSELAVRE